MQIKKSTYTFLQELGANNNRDWFQNNKARYEAARDNVAEWSDEMIRRLNDTDVIETVSGKKSMFRIYRDVRFSKNKSPYKTALSGHLKRDSKLRRGGYYFHLEPGENVIGGGFYGMEAPDLKRMREEIAADAEPMRAIIADPNFKRVFGEMLGDQLKTAPKGFDKEHPDIDLLRYKQFYAFRSFTEKEVLSASFADLSHEAFLTLRPFFDYFSEVLTTNANGELIV